MPTTPLHKTSMNQRILLVEDEATIRSTVKLNLELEGYDVTEARDGKEGYDYFQSAYFDLIITDVMMPEMDGYILCQKIRLANHQIPIIILTAKGASDERVHGLKLGADDYLAKPFNLEELLLRVSKLIKRNAQQPLARQQAQTYTIGGCIVNFLSFQITMVEGTSATLSKREIQLLKLLIERKNEVVSREEILRTVWEYDVYPSTRTIDNYIVSFRKYFEQNPKAPQHFFSIRGVGYKFKE
jgi:two-component system, OmpR family, alkaline phosphatase synthesis response regulator PhoP